MISLNRILFFIKNIDLPRSFKFFIQRRTRGWDDSELWHLDEVFYDFFIPRLVEFRNYHSDFPTGLTEDKWNEILDKIIIAFKYGYCYSIGYSKNYDKYMKNLGFKTRKELLDNYNIYDEGMDLFKQYLHTLWC
jgi:hypothetical protein